MLAAFASLVLSDVWPNMGIHDGDNKVVWTVGCCDGDLITVDFRDEVGDGNGGNGLLKIYNKTSGLTSSPTSAPSTGRGRSRPVLRAAVPVREPELPQPHVHERRERVLSTTVVDALGRRLLATIDLLDDRAREAGLWRDRQNVRPPALGVRARAPPE